MKELLKQYAAYNVWANQRIVELILALPVEKSIQEVPSSFNNLSKTILHMLDAESIWWQRMKLQERILVPSVNFNGSIKDACHALLQQSKQWEEWLISSNELTLTHVFQYQNTKREVFKQPVYQMLLHVFNHSTYHRGQLVNMLRQLGVQKIPQTDFVVWARSKK